MVWIQTGHSRLKVCTLNQCSLLEMERLAPREHHPPRQGVLREPEITVETAKAPEE